MKNKHIICMIVFLVLAFLFLICFTSCVGKQKLKKVFTTNIHQTKIKERISPSLEYERKQRQGFFPEYTVNVPKMDSSSPFYKNIEKPQPSPPVMPVQEPPVITPPPQPPQMPVQEPIPSPPVMPPPQPQPSPTVMPVQETPMMPIQEPIPSPPVVEKLYNPESPFTGSIEKYTPYYESKVYQNKETFFPEYTGIVKPLTTDSPFYGPITVSRTTPSYPDGVSMRQKLTPPEAPKMSSYSPFYGIINGGV